MIFILANEEISHLIGQFALELLILNIQGLFDDMTHYLAH
jgi:hypothetical protein